MKWRLGQGEPGGPASGPIPRRQRGAAGGHEVIAGIRIRQRLDALSRQPVEQRTESSGAPRRQSAAPGWTSRMLTRAGSSWLSSRETPSPRSVRYAMRLKVGGMTEPCLMPRSTMRSRRERSRSLSPPRGSYDSGASRPTTVRASRARRVTSSRIATSPAISSCCEKTAASPSQVSTTAQEPRTFEGPERSMPTMLTAATARRSGLHLPRGTPTASWCWYSSAS